MEQAEQSERLEGTECGSVDYAAAVGASGELPQSVKEYIEGRLAALASTRPQSNNVPRASGPNGKVMPWGANTTWQQYKDHYTTFPGPTTCPFNKVYHNLAPHRAQMKKLGKQAFSETQMKKRLAFQKAHEDWTQTTWKSNVQVVGDLRDFTWYPEDFRAKFHQLRSPWTYMTEAERKQPAFQRPKRWFPKKDWQRTKKVCVFGFTASNGRKLCFIVKKPWTSADWADLVKTRVGPWLKRTFPRKRSFVILLDGEKLLHAPVAKAALSQVGASCLPKWPGYSPGLNPQENVWAWAEETLREQERDKDSFEVFQKRVLKARNDYPCGGKLVASMAKRMTLLLDKKGANIGK